MQKNGIQVTNEEALAETVNVMKLIFTPLNSIIFLSCFGNIFGKIKDGDIDKEKASKSMIIVLIIFVVAIIFEENYMSGFIHDLLG